MAATTSLIDLERDPRLFLYTSLSAGSSHIITATSRMETILKANKIPFQAIDIATEEPAKKLWQRRAGGRKLPGLVKDGFVIGDLEQVEEWNEFGELKENIGPVPAGNVVPPGKNAALVGVQIAAPLKGDTTSVEPTSLSLPLAPPSTSMPVTAAGAGAGFDKSKGIALPGAAEVAALSSAKKEAAAKEREEAKRKEAESKVLTEPPKVETMASAPDEKKESIAEATAASEDNGGKEETVKDRELPESETSEPASEDKSTATVPTTDAAPAKTTTSSAPHIKFAAEPKPEKEVASAKAEEISASEPSTAADAGPVEPTPEKSTTEVPSKETPKDTEVALDTSTTEKLKDLKLGEEVEKTQEQAAKDPDSAEKSVED